MATSDASKEIANGVKEELKKVSDGIVGPMKGFFPALLSGLPGAETSVKAIKALGVGKKAQETTDAVEDQTEVLETQSQALYSIEDISQNMDRNLYRIAEGITGVGSDLADHTNMLDDIRAANEDMLLNVKDGLSAAEVEKAREEKRASEEQTTLLESMVNGIVDLKDSFLQGLQKSAGFGLGAIAGLIAAPVITLVNFFKTLSVEFKFLTKLTKNIAGGKLFAPIRGLFSVFRFIANASLSLQNSALKLLTKIPLIGGVFATIGDVFMSIPKIIGSIVQGAKIGEFFAFIGNTVMRAVNFVKGIFTPVINFFKTLTTFTGAASGAFSGIAKFAAGFGRILGKIFLPITILMSAFDFITGFMDGFDEEGILGGLEGGLSKVFANLIGMPLDLLKSAVSWIAGVFGFDGVSAALDSFSFSQLITDMIGGIFDGVSGIFTFLGDLFDFSDLSIFGIFQKLVDIVFLPLNLAINFVKGLFGFGDEEEPFSLSAFIGETVTSVINFVRGLFGFGNEEGEGEPFSLSAFIGETVTSVINWFSTLFTNPVDALSTLWTTLLGGFDSLMGLLFSPIDSAINWIRGIFGWSDPEGEEFSLWTTIRDSLSSVFEWVAGLFDFDLGNAIEGLLPDWTPNWLKERLGLSGERAVGGPVRAGDSYLVGENGPEMFTAGASGQITSNNRMIDGIARQTANMVAMADAERTSLDAAIRQVQSSPPIIVNNSPTTVSNNTAPTQYVPVSLSDGSASFIGRNDPYA